MKNILKRSYHKFNKNYQEAYLLQKEFQYFAKCNSVLDIGCGEGEFLQLDPEKVTGIDSNKASIAMCKRKGLQATFARAEKLPFPNDSFDGVHCAHVIEHLYPENAFHLLQEVDRVLKKNGVFVLSTPLLWKGFYNDFTHVKPYNPQSILRYMSNEGREKTLGNIRGRYQQFDLYWRYDILPIPGRIGYLMANYLYQYKLHLPSRNAYTLVLKKQ
jgi:SAM-dependent methyltransferase